ncbi:flavin containing amine oxidase [Pochonia chlamydosporia 170]|uniref:Flavin containing amine oxidase n=1 Tax=Pochonia chlamydosporia 170 TaxID=1380566 RepID=A0A179FJZ3_METCM|nr:flavin containing amine oxidase [Pochonia chlamydosporia 170]OAQ65854.1 flavin containing amine oxidase [Pochonia chlamydosporia 170]
MLIESQGPKIVVSTENGDFKFDEVVVTIPLGCLKRGTLNIDPQIPLPLYRAIQNASYSSLEKVYISFPLDFWGYVPTPAATTREGGNSPTSSIATPSFTHFLNPQYVPDEQKSWAIELVPLSSKDHFGSLAQPTLLFSLYGPCAAYVTSLIQNLSPNSAEYFDTLVGFFRPYYSLLPNYKAGCPECMPNAILATNWQNDELAGNGSYTNFQISDYSQVEGEEVHLDEDIRTTRAGLPDRGIWFAGEHTAPFIAIGTTTGAYWSGESAAVKILAANGLLSGQAQSPDLARNTEASRDDVQGVHVLQDAISPAGTDTSPQEAFPTHG